MKQKSNQPGFGTIGIVIVIAAVLAVAGTLGYMYYQNTHKDAKPAKVNNTSPDATTPKKDSAATKTDEQTADPVATEANVLTIPEFGVSMTLPEGLEASDVMYTYTEHIATESDPNPGTTAYLTTKSLLNLNPQCTTKYAPIGIIMRETKDNKRPYQPMHQVGKYYYTYIGPQVPCLLEKDGDLQEKQKALMRQAFETIKESN